MAWDIYGNPLQRGHCEVHPHVHEEYPCSVCMSERGQTQQPHDALQQLQYEFAQQGDYIKQLEAERDALAAQGVNLHETLGKALDLAETGAANNWYLEGADDIWITEALAEHAKGIPDAQQCLREVQAEAVLKFAGTILVKYRHDITRWAKEHAATVRQGGAE